MTLDDLRNSSAVFVDAKDVAGIIGVDAQAIRDQARTDVTQLGFPCARIGNKTKIPRQAFLRWLGE